MTSRKELGPELDTAILEALGANQAGIWTALPAIVQSYDATRGTVEAYCSLRFQARREDGTMAALPKQPLFVDCPVMFPGGGGYTLTFPIAAGDECLIIFASRCIDLWWDRSGVQDQGEFRMHDMSDGFALIGPRSRPRALTNASTANVELRNDSRTSYISIDPAGVISLLAPTINITGNLNITGVVTNNGKTVGSGIKVTGVQVGGGNSTGVL